jgi:hypothetical protein
MHGFHEWLVVSLVPNYESLGFLIPFRQDAKQEASETSQTIASELVVQTLEQAALDTFIGSIKAGTGEHHLVDHVLICLAGGPRSP